MAALAVSRVVIAGWGTRLLLLSGLPPSFFSASLAASAALPSQALEKVEWARTALVVSVLIGSASLPDFLQRCRHLLPCSRGRAAAQGRAAGNKRACCAAGKRELPVVPSTPGVPGCDLVGNLTSLELFLGGLQRSLAATRITEISGYKAAL